MAGQAERQNTPLFLKKDGESVDLLNTNQREAQDKSCVKHCFAM